MSPSRRKKRSGSGKDAERKVVTPGVSAVRRTARDITSASDLYGGGIAGNQLAGDILSDPKLYRKVSRAIQKRHDKMADGLGEDGVYRCGKHSWKVSLGIRLCLKRPLVWGQTVQKYPWVVTWVSPKTGKRMRKFFESPLSAVHFIATKAQYVDSRASLYSRSVGYDIPIKLRGKIPLPWRWCSRCMTARKFKRVFPEKHFYALRKEWNEEKERFEWHERKLAILKCPHCGCTNQDVHMRRSNQPWEVRKIKAGARRVKRRR